MLKKIFAAMLLTAITSVSVMNATVVNAADDNYELDEFIHELNQFEEPYYGYVPNDFDFNEDKTIDVFDLIYLKKEVISGENPEVSMATVVKLQSWLLGKPWASLSIETMPTNWFHGTSEYFSKVQKNIMSHDFRFVRASKDYYPSDDGDIYGVALSFISDGELTIETQFYSTVCWSVDELDEVVATRDGDGFVIGIKDGEYAIALVD